MKVTVITMYRSHDAELFTQVVEGELTAEQMDAWRQAHSCDEYDPLERDEDPSNMFFRVLDVLPNEGTADLLNVDGPVNG